MKVPHRKTVAAAYCEFVVLVVLAITTMPPASGEVVADVAYLDRVLSENKSNWLRTPYDSWKQLHAFAVRPGKAPKVKFDQDIRLAIQQERSPKNLSALYFLRAEYFYYAAIQESRASFDLTPITESSNKICEAYLHSWAQTEIPKSPDQTTGPLTKPWEPEEFKFIIATALLAIFQNESIARCLNESNKAFLLGSPAEYLIAYAEKHKAWPQRSQVAKLLKSIGSDQLLSTNVPDDLPTDTPALVAILNANVAIDPKSCRKVVDMILETDPNIRSLDSKSVESMLLVLYYTEHTKATKVIDLYADRNPMVRLFAYKLETKLETKLTPDKNPWAQIDKYVKSSTDLENRNRRLLDACRVTLKAQNRSDLEKVFALYANPDNEFVVAYYRYLINRLEKKTDMAEAAYLSILAQKSGVTTREEYAMLTNAQRLHSTDLKKSNGPKQPVEAN